MNQLHQHHTSGRAAVVHRPTARPTGESDVTLPPGSTGWWAVGETVVMRTVTIRPAIAADDDEIARITVDAYVAGGHLSGPDHRYAAELRRTTERREQAELLVAEIDGRVAGTITLVRGGTVWAEFTDVDDVEIRMLAVDPAHGGQGIGAALVDAVLARAAAVQANGVALVTMDSMHIARGIYQRRGFRRQPERDLAVPGVLLHAYRLDLTESPAG